MQAIVTKFLGPTDFKGSRIKATCEARPRGVAVAWEYGAGNGTGASDVEANHDRAAVEMIRAMGWYGYWIRGALPSGEGYCYVCLSRMDSRAECDWGPVRSLAGLLNGFVVREG